MADSFFKVYRYTKGVLETKVFDPATRNLLFYSNKISENQFQTNINANELDGGFGNAPLIAIPDTAKINLTLTTQDISLYSRQLQTGGALGYNGITDMCEQITATGATLTLSDTPVAPYGTASTNIVCYINGDGMPYQVNAATKVVQGFAATNGMTYSVRYYVAKAATQCLTMYTQFNPYIATVETKMAVYAVPENSATTQGSLIGYWHYVIPRMQFTGDASLNVNQTTYGTSSLNGTALAFDNPMENACPSNGAILAYMLWEPSDTTSGISSMVIPGGLISMSVGDTMYVPVKFLMKDGGTAQPDLTQLTYSVTTGAVASVSTPGLITASTAGDTEITVTSTSPALTCVANLSVTT